MNVSYLLPDNIKEFQIYWDSGYAYVILSNVSCKFIWQPKNKKIRIIFDINGYQIIYRYSDSKVLNVS